jgi:hypothetical protein
VYSYGRLAMMKEENSKAAIGQRSKECEEKCGQSVEADRRALRQDLSVLRRIELFALPLRGNIVKVVL